MGCAWRVLWRIRVSENGKATEHRLLVYNAFPISLRQKKKKRHQSRLQPPYENNIVATHDTTHTTLSFAPSTSRSLSMRAAAVAMKFTTRGFGTPEPDPEPDEAVGSFSLPLLRGKGTDGLD